LRALAIPGIRNHVWSEEKQSEFANRQEPQRDKQERTNQKGNLPIPDQQHD